MGLDKYTLWVNAILAALLGILLLAQFEVAGIGLAMLLLGVLNFFLAFIFLIARKTKVAQTMFLCCGILLLIGFSVCSTVSYGPMH